MSGKRAKTRSKSRNSGALARARVAQDRETTAPKAPDSLGKMVAESRLRELGNDGPIRAALDGLLARADRDDKGRFVRGLLKTGEHSEAFWVALEPVKADIVARVRKQLAAADDDAPETLLAIIDGFAEAHLLRKSALVRLCMQGGPVTNKGKVRGLLQAWGSFFDRELPAVERLGIARRARRAQTPIE